MPVYDFECPSCRHRFDALVKVDQTAPCPACGAADTVRLQTFSATVSTTGSRERSLKGARSKASGIKREKDHAHQEYMRQHLKDHD